MLRKIAAGILCLSFFISSCNSPVDAPAPAVDPAGMASVAAGDFAPGQLEAHYLKHGYQFGGISRNEYLEGARALLNAPVGGDVYGKSRSNGDLLRFRASTGEFAVMTSSGRIRTYFKTDYRYWMRQ